MNKGKKEKDSNIIECAKGEKFRKQKINSKNKVE